MNDIKSLLSLVKNPIPKKPEETKLFNSIINNFEKINIESSPEIIQNCQIIFKSIVETRLDITDSSSQDYLYIWKAFQTIRLLTRSKSIQKEMFVEKHLKIYELCLSKLIQITPRSNVIESVIEKTKVDFISLIIYSTSIIDNLFLLINCENGVILKLLQVLLTTVINENKVAEFFSKTSIVEGIIKNLYSNSPEIIEVNMDLIKLEIDNPNFINMFLYLDGYKAISFVIKKHSKSQEILLKILSFIQKFCKKEEHFHNAINNDIIESLFTILINKDKSIPPNHKIDKTILKIFTFLSMNDDLSILLRSNYLQSFLTLLIKFSLSLKSKGLKSEEIQMIQTNEAITIRILRIIFSLEKNKIYFKEIFPSSIFNDFVDIGNYRQDITEYSNFINKFNSLSQKDLSEIQNKINKMNQMKTGTGEEFPSSLSEYKNIEMIGKGGFGSVYKIKKNNEYYAMKTLILDSNQIKTLMESTKSSNQSGIIEKTIREIRIWKKLSHPNIIKYYTSIIEAGKVYIIMELIDGISLGEYITQLKEKKTSFNADLCLDITRQIVSALRYLHKEVGVTHRDLNPNNIMIDNNFNIKLIDFGLTFDQSKEDKESFSIKKGNSIFEGSIFYSSPEILNNSTVDFGCDIWALGCIVYEMMMLKQPFEGDNPLTIAKNICELNYVKMKEDQNKTVKELVESCLVINQKDRANIDTICRILGEFMFDKMKIDREQMELLKTENLVLKKIL
ncbi:MAG: serine/threonine-protein kinase [archaeon]|nr:serine/threonine-protein kinase [archaeon]